MCMDRDQSQCDSHLAVDARYGLSQWHKSDSGFVLIDLIDLNAKSHQSYLKFKKRL